MKYLFLMTLVVGVTLSPAPAQVPPCDAREMAWALKGNDPAYPDALELAQTLREHHFIVHCVLPSKMTGFFEGEKGAAVYRTDKGSFNALFLSKSQSFAGLSVGERHENNRHSYHFEGIPKPGPVNRIESLRPIYFLKHASQLLVIDDDVNLLNSLKAALRLDAPHFASTSP